MIIALVRNVINIITKDFFNLICKYDFAFGSKEKLIYADSYELFRC